MKRKKVLVENVGDLVFTDRLVRVTKFENKYFFEIGKEITSDLGEAVAILMRNNTENNSIWELEIDEEMSIEIDPEKALFWLTGGYKEWKSLENYNKPWSDCYIDFQEEFGFIIFNSIKKSKKIKDIKKAYLKYLNLPILYDFAISKDLVR
jgi:hypothetical protein